MSSKVNGLNNTPPWEIQLNKDLDPEHSRITRDTVAAAKCLFQQLKQEEPKLTPLADRVTQVLFQKITETGWVAYLGRVASAIQNFFSSGFTEAVSSEYLLLRSLGPKQMQALLQQLISSASPGGSTSSEVTHIIKDIKSYFDAYPVSAELRGRGFNDANLGSIKNQLELLGWLSSDSDELPPPGLNRDRALWYCVQNPELFLKPEIKKRLHVLLEDLNSREIDTLISMIRREEKQMKARNQPISQGLIELVKDIINVLPTDIPLTKKDEQLSEQVQRRGFYVEQNTQKLHDRLDFLNWRFVESSPLPELSDKSADFKKEVLDLYMGEQERLKSPGRDRDLFRELLSSFSAKEVNQLLDDSINFERNRSYGQAGFQPRIGRAVIIGLLGDTVLASLQSVNEEDWAPTGKLGKKGFTKESHKKISDKIALFDAFCRKGDQPMMRTLEDKRLVLEYYFEDAQCFITGYFPRGKEAYEADLEALLNLKEEGVRKEIEPYVKKNIESVLTLLDDPKKLVRPVPFRLISLARVLCEKETVKELIKKILDRFVLRLDVHSLLDLLGHQDFATVPEDNKQDFIKSCIGKVRDEGFTKEVAKSFLSLIWTVNTYPQIAYMKTPILEELKRQPATQEELRQLGEFYCSQFYIESPILTASACNNFVAINGLEGWKTDEGTEVKDHLVNAINQYKQQYPLTVEKMKDFYNGACNGAPEDAKKRQNAFRDVFFTLRENKDLQLVKDFLNEMENNTQFCCDLCGFVNEFSDRAVASFMQSWLDLSGASKQDQEAVYQSLSNMMTRGAPWV